jgi:hypothetical protein
MRAEEIGLTWGRQVMFRRKMRLWHKALGGPILTALTPSN